MRVDGSAANFGTPSPAESSGAPVRQAYNSIFESSQATGQMSRARATSQSHSAADGIDSMFMPGGGVRSSNEHVEELLAPRVDGERNMFYDIDAAGQWRMKKPKKSGRPQEDVRRPQRAQTRGDEFVGGVRRERARSFCQTPGRCISSTSARSVPREA